MPRVPKVRPSGRLLDIWQDSNLGSELSVPWISIHRDARPFDQIEQLAGLAASGHNNSLGNHLERLSRLVCRICYRQITVPSIEIGDFAAESSCMAAGRKGEKTSETESDNLRKRMHFHVKRSIAGLH